MSNISDNLATIQQSVPKHVTLVAVSKTKPNELIKEAYACGQRDFGENKVQELTDKYEALPKDIRWHMIGHLQRNKVKYIAPFVYLIHGVDTFKLLKEINKRAQQNDRVINCLFQIHIAKEDTKFGFSEEELHGVLQSKEYQELNNVKMVGLMGMATNTDNEQLVRTEFEGLKQLFDRLKNESQPQFTELSMGMSGDYELAIACGSSMVRVGSAIFGARNYPHA